MGTAGVATQQALLSTIVTAQHAIQHIQCTTERHACADV